MKRTIIRTIIVTVMKLLCLLVPCGVVASPYALEVAPHTEQLSNNSVMMMERGIHLVRNVRRSEPIRR